MSQANVETAQRVYDAFERGGIDAVIDFLDPEVIWEDIDALPGARTYRGHDGFRMSAQSFFEAWGQLRLTPQEHIDAGDTVVSAHRWQAVGKESGTPIDMLVWNVMTFRGGNVVRRRAFVDRAKALEAAGLSE
jgi:ketosteroid isomerase-like protein